MTCTVGATPAGTHKVLVTAGAQGLALPKSTSSNLAKVSLRLGQPTILNPTLTKPHPNPNSNLTITLP